MKKLEHGVERVILATRWMLAPLYLGMCASMAVFVIKFFQELFHLLSNVMHSSEAEWIIGILALIDNVLVANLVVMVLISGYETFVSPINIENPEDRPGWLNKLDPGTVKIKFASSVVGISLVHMLAVYLKMGEYDAQHMLWQAVFHSLFVLTALLLAFVDNVASSKHRAG